MSHHYLRFDDVHYRYPNGYEALCGVSFCITHGEKVALVGANGAGKSTLLLHTNGLLIPSQGEVVMGGIKLTRRTLPLVRQSVGLVFQDSDNQLFMPTVEEDVAFGPSNMRLEPEEIRRRVTEALDAVGALHLRGASPFRLSGGQKKRVAIATVLSMEPSVLVMDEPTSNLDPRARRQIIDSDTPFRPYDADRYARYGDGARPLRPYDRDEAGTDRGRRQYAARVRRSGPARRVRAGAALRTADETCVEKGVRPLTVSRAGFRDERTTPCREAPPGRRRP